MEHLERIECDIQASNTRLTIITQSYSECLYAAERDPVPREKVRAIRAIDHRIIYDGEPDRWLLRPDGKHQYQGASVNVGLISEPPCRGTGEYIITEPEYRCQETEEDIIIIEPKSRCREMDTPFRVVSRFGQNQERQPFEFDDDDVHALACMTGASIEDCRQYLLWRTLDMSYSEKKSAEMIKAWMDENRQRL